MKFGRGFTFQWEKSYHDPALYSLHFDKMTDFGLLILATWPYVK